MDLQIGFIGAGNMTHALVMGLLKQRYAPQKIWVSNPHNNENLIKFHQKKINTTSDNAVVAAHSDILVFAVKPHVLPEVARSLASAVQNKRSCVLSIAAGVRLDSLQTWIGTAVPLIRAMPNTPALVGYAATGLYANKYVSAEQKQAATFLMEAVGKVVCLEREEQLDIITALSGSGPAYFFLMMSALEEAAIELGLPNEIAHNLTVQTALGAAHLAEGDKSLIQLQQQVTSPGGTTECAVKVLEQNQIRAIFAKALRAAQERSIELGKEHD